MSESSSDGVNSANPSQATSPASAAAPNEAVLAELTELRAYRDRSLAQEADQKRLAQEADQKRLADQGKVDELVRRHAEALAERDQRHREFADRARRTERDRALVAALAGQPLASTAVATQLARLWADDFECVDGPGGDFVVRARGDLRTPAQVVAERLGHADYAHCVRADNRGGGGAGGSTPAATPAPGADGREPKDLGEAALARWAQGDRKADGSTFGLRGKL